MITIPKPAIGNICAFQKSCVLSLQSAIRHLHTPSPVLRVSKEVQDAIHSKRPVVALESTIYTHGLPYPDNLRLANRLEGLVRRNGGVPATVGVLDGIARVGLQEIELTRLVESPGARKISRRDLGIVLGSAGSQQPLHGGTTISGTMILAHLAGIKVFSTGGLGGVHRGGQDTMDISADLTELGKTPVAVICSGCKGFLDIPRTLEYLETQGVAVATFADGRKTAVDFPAFWSRESGVRSPLSVQDELEAAAAIYAQNGLPVSSGMLFANPVPLEHSIPRKELETVIDQAIDMARSAGVRGGENTPFVLNAIKNLSGGKSVQANQALIESNVLRGTKVAVELSRLERKGRSQPSLQVDVNQNFVDRTSSPRQETPHIQTQELVGVHKTSSGTSNVDIVVAGAIAIDTSCNYQPSPEANTRTPTDPTLATSNPARISQAVGGVAFNVAKAAHLSGADTRLCSLVGDDLSGSTAIQEVESLGMQNAILKSPNSRTSQYVTLNDANDEMYVAMADMSIFDQPGTSLHSDWQPHIKALADSQTAAQAPRWFVADANWNPDTLHAWVKEARSDGLATAFEPVSVAKAPRLFPAHLPHNIPPRIVDMAAPNTLELCAMHDAMLRRGLHERHDWWTAIDALGIPGSGARAELSHVTSPALVDQGIPQRCIQLLPFVATLVTKLGPKGVLLTRILLEDDCALRSPEAAPYVVARSKTGAAGVAGLYMRLFPPSEVLSAEDGAIKSVNGAGDTFLGALLAGLVKARDTRVEHVVDAAQRASLLTLKSGDSVSSEIGKMV